jgi:hypothetical protein
LYFFIGASYYYRNDFIRAKKYFDKSIKYTYGRNIDSRIDTSVFRPELISLYYGRSCSHPSAIPAELRKGASLEILSELGSNCKIILDGKEIGSTSAYHRMIKVTPGKHSLKLVYGFWKIRKKIEIKDGEYLRLEVHYRFKYADFYLSYRDSSTVHSRKKRGVW